MTPEEMQFLLEDSKALHSNLQELHAIAVEHTRQLEEDAKRWRTVARIIRAGLNAAFNEDGNEPEAET